jgi:DNA repair exonuclease SbcCD nuclease subunit
MIINGKTLLFTDIHFGLKNNSTLKLKICVNVIKTLVETIKKNKIENCIFAGDLFHNRINLSVDTINVVLKCISYLASHCKVYLIIGNHDIYNKNRIDVNSMNIFKDTPNVIIIDKPTIVSINGNKTLLSPWLSNLSTYDEETFDMMIGHFEISSKYLIASYIEEHTVRNKIDDNIVESFLGSESAINDIDTIEAISDDDIKILKKSKSGDLIGSFVNIVKKNGVIFSGHIHGHKEFLAKGRNFIFIGSPYEQNFGEMNMECGYYILDKNNKYKFHAITNTPKHIQLKMSEIIEDIDSFDYSIVTNNIIQKIYDIEIDRVQDAKITQKIIDNNPYEESIPIYEVTTNDNNITVQSETLDNIKKSKLDYIKSYIDNIDSNILTEQNLNKDILFKCIETYYNKVAN